MSKVTANRKILISVILLFMQLIILYLFKYYNQDLSINNFSILKTGNFINLLIYAGIIAGIFISLRKGKQIISVKSINIFILISYFLLLVSIISTKVEIIKTSAYFFDQPFNKVLTGLLFLFYFFSLIYFLVFIWSQVISAKKISIIRIITRSFFILLLFLIAIILFIDNISYTSGRWVLVKSKKNVAVVLGAAVWSGNIPSPTLSSRVDKALELLKDGFAGEIVLTGGKAPGELSESEVAFEYARIKGVDTSKVVIENVTSSTSDQIRWISDELVANQKNISDIIIISDAYHLPRAIEISKFFNLDIKVAQSAHKQEFNDKIFTKIRECIAVFNFWNFAL